MGQKKTTSRRTDAKSSATRGGTSNSRKSTTTRRSASRAKKPRIQLNLPQKALISGIALIFFTALIVLSLLSPNQGQLTAALASLMWRLFGWGGLVAPVAMGLTGFYLVLWGMGQGPELPQRRLLGLTLLFLTAEAFASMGYVSFTELTDVWAVAQAETGGGYVGAALVWAANRLAGEWGPLLIFLAVGSGAAVLTTNLTREDVVVFFHEWRARRQEAAAFAAEEAAEEAARQAAQIAAERPSPAQPPIRRGGGRIPAEPAAPIISPDLRAEPEAAPKRPPAPTAAPAGRRPPPPNLNRPPPNRFSWAKRPPKTGRCR
jgi:hypothetical protein